MNFNPFIPNAPFFYPLKTSENLTVFLYFQWVERKGELGMNGSREHYYSLLSKGLWS